MLVCNICGRGYGSDAGYVLTCCEGGLLVADYATRFEVDTAQQGLWRFHDWLPVERPGEHPIGGVTFEARELGDAIGVPDLWLSFNGYWPERGSNCPTCSFKDLEAGPTFERLVECGAAGVVVATAGNTGRAFAHLGGTLGFPVLVVAAEIHVERLWRPGAAHAPTTHIVGLAGGDYGDAGDLARELAPALGWATEGSVHNVARRDGIGTLLLDAVHEMGRLPDHYVQAVGGGPGPIGVGEMAARLVADGRFGDTLPRVHLVQNVEHQPVNRAWRSGRVALEPADFPAGEVETFADVLVNRRPAYGIKGGLHDLLTSTKGQTYVVEAAAARDAGALFEELIGIDILEPSAVALAGLQQAAAAGEVPRGESVLLAVTGGGQRRLFDETEVFAPDDALMVPLVGAFEAVTDHMGRHGV